MLALRLWVFLSIYATIHAYDVYLTETCDPDYVVRLIRESCNADRRRSIAHNGLLVAAMKPKAPATVSVSEILGVPKNWTAEEDAMLGVSSVKVRQNNEKFQALYDYCCQHHCDERTFRGIC